MSKIRNDNGIHNQLQHEETQKTKSTVQKSTMQNQVVTSMNSGAPEGNINRLLPYIVTTLVLVVTALYILYCRARRRDSEPFTSVQLPAVISPIKRLDEFYNGEVINTLHIYFELKIMKSSTWTTFLDERLHELFHSFKNGICCKNSSSLACGSIKKAGHVTKEQFFLLYQEDQSIPVLHELKDARGRIMQQCICPLAPNTYNDVSNLDITLMCILMNTARMTPAGNPSWFQDIKHVRNVIIAHRGDESSLTEENVNRHKEKLEKAIINIAGTIGPAFQRGVKRRISEDNSKYLQIDDIKDTFVFYHAELERKIMKALGGQYNDIIIGNKRFHFSRPTLSSEMDNIQTQKGKKTCIIKWKFTDPGDWDIRAMKRRLRNIRKLGDFEVKFIYEGSVIIHTTSDISQFTKDESSIRDITEEFLFLFVMMLRLQTAEQRCISYSLQIITDHAYESTDTVSVSTTHAQVPIKQSSLRKPVLIKQFDISQGSLGLYYGCTSIDETFVITDYNNKRLILWDANSDNVRYVRLSGPLYPFLVTAIDNTTVAVHVRLGNSYIQIIDVSNSRTIRTLRTEGFIDGLSHHDGYLYVGSYKKGIQVMDLHGKVIRRLQHVQTNPYNLTVHNNCILHTDSLSSNELFCSSLSGEKLWQCKISIISGIHGLTIDDEGYIYAAGGFSNNVVVISPERKQFRQLLSDSDGLKDPFGICYNRKLNTLMVCNRQGPAFLYKIEK